MTYDCSSAPMPDIIDRLKEHAEWAEANIYEVPIMLPDDISEAVKEIEMNRAAFEKAYAANEDLFIKLAQMKMERDAAAADLQISSDCDFCKWLIGGNCTDLEHEECHGEHWEWRGVQEVEHGN